VAETGFAYPSFRIQRMKLAILLDRQQFGNMVAYVREIMGAHNKVKLITPELVQWLFLTIESLSLFLEEMKVLMAEVLDPSHWQEHLNYALSKP
jgi:hypothetical protein